MHPSFGQSDKLEAMKILLAPHLFFPAHQAGTEVLTLELARSLRQKGHAVTIVTCARHQDIGEESGPWLSKDNYDGFDVFSINFLAGNQLNSITHHAESSERAEILVALVKQLSPDLVHFQHANGFSSAAIPAIKKLGIPVFFTATDFWSICSRTNLYKPHTSTVCDGPKTPAQCLACALPMLPESIARAIMVMANDKTTKISNTLGQLYALKRRLPDMTSNINMADGIFAATHFQAGMLTKYGVSRANLKVFPYGVRLGELPGKAEVPGTFSAEAPMKIAFIGSLTRIKGVHVFLKALRKLSPEKLARLDVSIYGKTLANDDDYGRELKSHAAKLPPTIKFAGTFPHDEIGSILRSQHLCVVPSIWYENAPLVLCSAVAAGIPALVSKFDGMTEVIKEGVNGLSFSAGNPDALAQMLERLIDDAGWIRNALSQAAASYRTPDDYCNDIEAEYLSVIHARGTHSR